MTGRFLSSQLLFYVILSQKGNKRQSLRETKNIFLTLVSKKFNQNMG